MNDLQKRIVLALYGVAYKMGFLRMLPDEVALRLEYRLCFGKKLNLDSPKTFNEKIQWLKLYDRDPIYTVMVDKYLAKGYAEGIIGKEHIIPTIGVWDNPEEIDFALLPERFVLKCNHNSGLGMYICKGKSALSSVDIKKIKEDLQKGLSDDFFFFNREWPYKNVERKIIAEPYMEDESGELIDYKVFCFNGEPKLVQIDYNRFISHKRIIYSVEWRKMDIEYAYPNGGVESFPKPDALNEMLCLARALANGHPFLRTDFYVAYGKVYFGELTFYPEGGFGQFKPDEWNYTLGSWIELPKL